MLRIEELDALDLLIWLQSAVTAAAVAGTNQSTIGRRARRALATFKAELVVDKGTRLLETPLGPLLDLQRRIHQLSRFKTSRSLRLEVPLWSRPALRTCLPPGWIPTPEEGPRVCDNPLELLRAHVIDACLLTPTQLAGAPPTDLAVFDLYSSRIDLHLLADGDAWSQALESPLGAQELLEHGRLQMLSFLPSSCRISSNQRMKQLRAELGLPCAATGAVPPPQFAGSAPLAFLTPLMALGLGALRPLSLPLEWPYRESLVVLRSNVEQPAVQVLVETLQRQLPGTLQRLVPGGTAALR